MKVVVIIKPARGRAYNLLRHCYLAQGRQPNEVESISGAEDRVYGLINGLAEGGLVRNAGTDAHTLIADLPQNRAQVRHVVISAEETADPEGRQCAYEALADLCEQFAKKYASGTPYVGVIHQDRLHPHLHLIFKNCDGENESALVWNRDQLAEMQSMEWVSETTKEHYSIQSGRSSGRTQREGTGMPYPLAALSAWKLATAAINEIENYESADILNIHRHSSDKIHSVKFDGREIRMSTLRNLASYSRLHPATGNLPAIKARRNRRVVPYRPSPSPSLG